MVVCNSFDIYNVHFVEDSTLMSIFDQFRFSFVFLELPKIGPNRLTYDSWWHLLILGYDATASSNLEIIFIF